MAKYIIHWKNGKKEEVSGRTFAAAFNKNYSPNALQFLDRYEEVKKEKK